ncbi:MAG: metal-sulfur cluster assembly factor [Gaiellales bacterium]
MSRRAPFRGRSGRAGTGTPGGRSPTPASVREALADVLDPEYPVSVVDLGLVRGVQVAGSTVRVEVAFCSLGCPCTELIRDDIEERVAQLPGVDHVAVEEVFERWTRHDITPAGRARLRGAGVA